MPAAAYPNAKRCDEDEDSIVVEDDAGSSSGDDDEQRVLAERRHARPRGARDDTPKHVPSPPSLPADKAGTSNASSVAPDATPPTPALHSEVPPQPQGQPQAAVAASATRARPSGGAPGAAATLLAEALRKVDSQKKMIAQLVLDKQRADEAAQAAQGELVALRDEMAAMRKRAAEADELAKQAHAVLGLAKGVEGTAASQLKGLSAHERAVRLRELIRPVFAMKVGGVGTSKLEDILRAKQQQQRGGATSANDDEDDCDGKERAKLTGQIEELERALERSHANGMKLHDMYESMRAERDRAQGGGPQAELAAELARVQEVLSESTASWDAKQQELQRLRTLMRFSVLKQDSDKLQGTLERCDQLEIALGQERRKGRQLQFDNERLERQLDRALADSRIRKAASAELKRLRLLETHVLAIIGAEDRDPAFHPSAHRAAPAPVGASGRPASAGTYIGASGRPSSASSPRTAPAPKPLRALLPPHLLRAADAKDSAAAAAETAGPSPQSEAPANAASTDAAKPVAVDATHRPASAKDSRPALPLAPKPAESGNGDAGNPASTSSAPPPPVAASVSQRPAETTLASTATAEAPADAAAASAPAVDPSKPTPTSPEEDDGTAPINEDTPFSVIASRMAKYLAKREEEKKQKKEAAEAEARADMERRAAAERRRSRPSSAGYAAAAALSASTRGSGGFALPSDRVFDSTLKREYSELRSRVGAASYRSLGYPAASAVGGARSSPRGSAAGGLSHRSASSGGGFRPTSAPVSRRPLSANRR